MHRCEVQGAICAFTLCAGTDHVCEHRISRRGVASNGLKDLVEKTAEETLNALLNEGAIVEMCLAGVSARRIEDVSRFL